MEKIRFVENLILDNDEASLFVDLRSTVYEPVEFPFLTRLTTKSVLTHMAYLMRIRAPRLRALHMQGLCEDTVRVFRLFPTITFLGLSGYPSDIPSDHDYDSDEDDTWWKWQVMDQILGAIPSSVETLQVNYELTNCLWAYLKNLKVLPNLKKVVVDHHAMKWELRAFLDMVEVRDLDVQIDLKGPGSLEWLAYHEEPEKERWARYVHRATVTYN